MSKAVLITGSGKRMGKAFALHLAKKGYDIALHVNKSLKEAIVLQEKIIKLGVKCEIFEGDLTNKNFISSLLLNVKDKFNKLEMLINNASIFNDAKLIETDNFLFEKNFDLHVKAPFFLIKDFANQVSKGLIINMLDTRVSKNKSRYFAYTLSKKTLMELTKMAASELSSNIRVNAIAPGFILPPVNIANKDFEMFQLKNPMNKKGDIKDILKALDFFIESTYITGQILYVDGGENL